MPPYADPSVGKCAFELVFTFLLSFLHHYRTECRVYDIRLQVQLYESMSNVSYSRCLIVDFVLYCFMLDI